jgi:hypothetical protein
MDLADNISVQVGHHLLRRQVTARLLCLGPHSRSVPLGATSICYLSVGLSATDADIYDFQALRRAEESVSRGVGTKIANDIRKAVCLLFSTHYAIIVHIRR